MALFSKMGTGINFFKTLFLLSFFLPHSSFAQEKDFGVWTTLILKKNLSKKIALQLREEVRLKENVTKLDQHFTDISAQFKPWKFLLIEVNYRMSAKQGNEGAYTLRHRPYFNIMPFATFGKVELSLRERFQMQFEKNKEREYYLRTKPGIAVGIKEKLEWYAAVDFYLELREPFLDLIRSETGVEYYFSPKSTFIFYLLMDQEINVDDPAQLWILGVGYKYTFD